MKNRIFFIACLYSFSSMMLSCGTSDDSGLTAKDLKDMIVKSRVTIELGNSTSPSTLPNGSTSQGTSVNITNSASTFVTTDQSGFLGNPLTINQNAVTNLGNIKITEIFDNNLKVCGPSGDKKCTTAIIRVYTTGTAKAGIYSSSLDYGAPFYGGVLNPLLGLLPIGLGSENAVIAQSITIANSKHVIVKSDFSALEYTFKYGLLL
jgi:hypothetical protein